MIESFRGKSSPPPWDTPLTTFIHNDAVLLAACTRAGFVLLRDAARPTVKQLQTDHGFTPGEARELHALFKGNDRREEVPHGDTFIDLAVLYARDAAGGGEGNVAHAKAALKEMFGKP